MKPAYEAFLSVILSLPERARLYYQGKMVTEGSFDASSQYIVNSMTYLVGYFPFCKYLLMS